MDHLIELIKSGQAHEAKSVVESVLQAKTMQMIAGERRVVAESAYRLELDEIEGPHYIDSDHSEHPFHSHMVATGHRYFHSFTPWNEPRGMTSHVYVHKSDPRKTGVVLSAKANGKAEPTPTWKHTST